MFNNEAIEQRRNPLTKQQEVAKKQELKKLSSGSVKLPDKVYGLCVGSEEEPIFFYVGIAIDTDVRWKQHQRGIANGFDLKPAYEWCRYHKLKDTVRMIVLDPEGELTEQDWMDALLEEGHPLQNATGGVNVKRRKRQTDVNRHLLLGAATVNEDKDLYRDWLNKTMSEAHKRSEPFFQSLIDTYNTKNNRSS